MQAIGAPCQCHVARVSRRKERASGPSRWQTYRFAAGSSSIDRSQPDLCKHLINGCSSVPSVDFLRVIVFLNNTCVTKQHFRPRRVFVLIFTHHADDILTLRRQIFTHHADRYSRITQIFTHYADRYSRTTQTDIHSPRRQIFTHHADRYSHTPRTVIHTARRQIFTHHAQKPWRRSQRTVLEVFTHHGGPTSALAKKGNTLQTRSLRLLPDVDTHRRIKKQKN